MEEALDWKFGGLWSVSSFCHQQAFHLKQVTTHHPSISSWTRRLTWLISPKFYEAQTKSGGELALQLATLRSRLDFMRSNSELPQANEKKCFSQKTDTTLHQYSKAEQPKNIPCSSRRWKTFKFRINRTIRTNFTFRRYIPFTVLIQESYSLSASVSSLKWR